MADLSNPVKRKLEALFEMGGGYVLDFSNATFADFVVTSIGVDPYEKYPGGSKASLLRQLWREESGSLVSTLNNELLDYWKDGKLLRGETLTSSEQQMFDDLKGAMAALRDPASPVINTAFLAKDFGIVDLTALPTALTATEIVQARLDEIEKAMRADAPLAVIFLVGSTLEALLNELASSQANVFSNAHSAPKNRDGRVKPPQDWTLAELIAVSRELGVLSTDVAEHADQVRNFRNYIHPRQQLKENFSPRGETARIAQQVLIGALKDLEALTQRSSSDE